MEAAELTSSAVNQDLEIRDIQYDPTGKPNSQRAINEAKEKGLLVVFPAENELQIDIDNEHSYQMYVKQMDIVTKYVGVESFIEHPSKSGLPKRHITVRLKSPVTMIERIALQACLGSDRVREVLGYVQYKNGDPNPVLFLEKPVEITT
jgi:hypothetical protein